MSETTQYPTHPIQTEPKLLKEQGSEPQERWFLHWEKLPNGFFLLPLIFWAIYRTLKAGPLWTLSAVNPGLTFGGFFGFPKTEAYKSLPKWSYPTTTLIKTGSSFEQTLLQIQEKGLNYPFVAKPDGGMVGLLVRVIRTEADLKHYHAVVQADWMAQELVKHKMELGVFYVRNPKEEKGRIVGLTHKIPLSVVGDGRSTVKTLVDKMEDIETWKSKIYKSQKNNLDTVLSQGEQLELIFTGNRKNGARLVGKMEHVDEALTALFDKLSHHNDDIFYGRYDIKCASIESLKAGKDFAVLEFNGNHSGYGHVYHCGKTAKEAYRHIKSLWNELYTISEQNHRTGTPFMPFWAGFKYIFKMLSTFRKLSKWEKKVP